MCKACQNPERCIVNAKKWANDQETSIDKGEELLKELRERQLTGSFVRWTGHATKRSLERSISEPNVRLLINQDADVFEYYANSYGKEKLSLMGNLKLGIGKYRPIHVILKRNGKEEWKVVTMYDPSTEEFRWSNNYQTKICFCPK